MNAFEILKKDRIELVEKLIENMKKGYIFKPEWDVSALQPQNPVSNAIYKGINKLKLMAEAIEKEYDDPRWLTFKQATEQGYKIKKGAKGIRCEKWICTEKIKEKDEKTGEMVEIEKELPKPIASYFTVFNGTQIEGLPPLEKIKPEKEQISEIINNVIESSECPIKLLAQDRAFYSQTNDEIILPLRKAFKSEESFLATALHEIGHSTGHPSRLDRDMSGSFGSESYAKEELVAELAAVFTQARLNIKLEGEHFNDHTAYLKSWIGALKNDPNELFKAAKYADKASERIYSNYLEFQKEQIKETDNSIEKLQEIPEIKQKRFFRGFIIDFEYSEKELGIKENTILRATEAYKFLEKLVAEDKIQNEKKACILAEAEKGNFIPGDLYYKTKLEIQYKNYNTGKIRVDLGDLEFGGKEKVSDALEYRLKLWPNELIARKYEFAELEKTTPEKIVETAQDMLGNIDDIIKSFKKQESLYLENLEQKKEIIKDNAWAKKLDNDKIQSLTLGR